MNVSRRVEHKARVLKGMFPDCVRDTGYWVYWPIQNRGFWTAEDLSAMAEILNRANRKWDEQVKADLRPDDPRDPTVSAWEWMLRKWYEMQNEKD